MTRKALDQGAIRFRSYIERSCRSKSHINRSRKRRVLNRLSSSERWRFQLARAFVDNPHILAKNRPVQELDDTRQTVACIQDFVQRRGWEVETDDIHVQQRRPRTIIFTTGSSGHIDIADYVILCVAPRG
ncbi:Slc8a1 [Symbiodinium sp. CCMP2592]|nr:Slc8a1 [Symbiodinium sp. CCMP2592]